MSHQIIQETVNELVDLEEHIALHEAGGFWSFITRAFKGTDQDLAKNIIDEIPDRIKTEEDRKEFLAEVDGFIKEAELAELNYGKGWPKELQPGVPALPGSDLFKKRWNYMKEKGALKANFKQVATMYLIGNLGLVLISAIVRMIAISGGTVGKYTAGLKEARSKVASYKIQKKSEKD